MKQTPVMEGAHFGHLAKVHGIVTWKLSPFEQRAFPNMFSHAIPNTFRRIRSSIFYFIPQFFVGFIVFATCEHLHKKYQRKNPADYENEEED